MSISASAALLVALLLVATLAACGSGGASAAKRSLPPSARAPSPAVRDSQRTSGFALSLQPARGAKLVSLPPGVVATVAGAPITRRQFEGLYRASGSAPLDPPRYTRGIAATRRLLERQPSASAQTSGAQLKRQCERRHATLVSSAMSALIQRAWTAEQAHAARVTVSDAEVAAEVARVLRLLRGRSAGPLARRLGEARLRAAVRLQLLSQKLYASRAADAAAVSEAQVSAYLADAHVHPGKTLSRAALRARARRLLQQRALAAHVQALALSAQRSLRAQTLCRPGYLVSLCANALAPGGAL